MSDPAEERRGVPVGDALEVRLVATDFDRPVGLLREQLSEDRPYSLVELSQRAGLSVVTTRRIIFARGLDRTVFGERDVEYLRKISKLLAFLPEDVVIRATRVRTRALFQVMTSDLVLARRHLLSPLIASGATDDELMEVLADANDLVMPTIALLLGEDYLAGMEDLLDNTAVQAASNAHDAVMVLSVGFVDLVGYTSLSTRIDPEGLDGVLGEFEDHVHAIVEATPHVTIAKFIGDAAMLIGSEVNPVAQAVYEIVSSSRADLAAAVRRGAVTTGPIVAREGDYFGTPVNMAARLTDLARGGSVLTDLETAEQLTGFHQKKLGASRLRGLGDVRPVLLTRP